MKINHILGNSLLITLLVFAGCKKYGYEFEDGVENASGNEKNITVDTSMLVVDRSAYTKARVFPGLVSETEPRVANAKFTLDMNFTNQTAENLRISVAPQPWFGTGYYAAPGELVKLVVPAGVNGLTIQVGGHTDNLTGLPVLLRDPIMVNKKQLYPGANFIRNLYGGYIYIIADFAIANPVEFIISGACLAPDFELGKSNDAQWMAQVRASQVPWLELRSKRVIYLVPRDLLVAKFTSVSDPLNKPTELMTEWNKIFEDHFNGWMGLSDNAPDIKDRSPQGPWRGTVDIQISGYPTAAGHSGFPFMGLMNYNGSEWFQTWVSLNQLRTNQPKPNWGTYHEFGHNLQQNTTWNWSALGESTNNLFSYKVAKAYGQDFKILHPPNEWNTEGLTHAASTLLTIPVTTVTPTPAAGKNFDVNLNSGRENGSFARTVPFVQLMELYNRKRTDDTDDYGLITYIYKAARHAPRLANNDQDKKDNFYEWSCDYTGINLMPFFYQWGISVSAVSQLKIANKYPILTKNLWTYDIMTKAGGTVNINFTSYRAAGASSQSSTATLQTPALTDNDNATYWQTSSSNQFPFTLTLDAQFIRPVKGLSFVQSTVTTSRVKDIEILSSTNNTTFTSVGTFQIPNNTTIFNANFNVPVNARYFRIVLNNNWANTQVATLADLATIQ
ncbi:M60 family metallopeptidase [Pedobacter heparinus]|uniref:M60 family metallopeptidase n=1 Tax=Pedobacter heparinus TaxID=984 RepID=UPI002931B696|nr:M60 family metallopeptidase [Pedobacter heparinus]